MAAAEQVERPSRPTAKEFEKQPRKKGTGTVEYAYDRRGYLTVRGKLRIREAVHLTDGVGLGPKPTKEQRRAAYNQADDDLGKLRARLADRDAPDRDRERRTLSRQLDLWLAAKQQTAPRSHDKYDDAIRLHLKPYAIVRVPMGELTGDDMDTWLARLVKDGCSAATRLYVFERLTECLRAFVRSGELKNVRTILNSATDRRPRHRKKETRPLDEAEAAAFLAYLRSGKGAEPFASFFGTALCAGLRYSEAAALPCGEVHGILPYLAWRRKKAATRGEPPAVAVTVRWQMDRDTRQPREPKTEKGVRTVPLHAYAADLLADHWEREQKKGRAMAPSDLVFAHRGRDLAYSNTRRKLLTLLAEANLTPSGRTHVMRHTFGTGAANEGVPTHVLQALMGHADAKTTLIYTHASEAENRRQMGRVGLRMAEKGRG